MRKKSKNLILITVHLTKYQIKTLDELVKQGFFPSRSEAIRVAVRELIDSYLNRQRDFESGNLVLGL